MPLEPPQDPQQEEGPVVEWLDDERRANTFRNELQRLKRRAKKRPILLIVITAMMVTLVLWKKSKKVHLYQATIVMRATEGELIDEESPFAVDGLANYLFTIALNRERLKPIIEKYDLFPEREEFGDLYAVSELRGFLDIEINSNAFSRVKDEGDPVRSVGIAVHFTDFDPELAFDVATDLAAALVEAEQARRMEAAYKLKKIADATVDAVERRLSDHNSNLASQLITIDKYKNQNTPEARGQVAAAKIAKRRILEDIKQLDQVLTAMVGNQEELSLALAVEGANQGMRFDVVDVRRPEYIPKKSLIFYAILGIFLFVMLVPLVAIGIAAKDSKLHHIDDLIRLNMPVVGHLPGFPGDSKGSLQERGSRAKDIA